MTLQQTMALWFCLAGVAIHAQQPAPNPATGRPPPSPGKDYDQWTEARRGTQATAASAIHAAPGFEVELLRSAQPGEGSWVSMAFDPQGRIFIAKEGTGDHKERGILRLTLPKEKTGAVQVESINDTLQECRGLLWAFDSLYARCNVACPDSPSGLYRLRDPNGDGRFSDVKLLRSETGGGHGINDLTLGPDNRLYLIQGDQSGLPSDWKPADSRVRHFGFDQLLPGLGSSSHPSFGDRPPLGCLVRTDADGKSWEVVAAGMRNPFGLDFNADGELFTYDADMELYVGLPWYRPTHLIHIVSGIDYGWRDGPSPWPFEYADRPPVNLIIGLGSPTAVKFGTRSNFPPRYREALFLLDWAYGRILAVHLSPRGASYDGVAENFLDGRPLNVTDLDFGPDGAMYFITGGRQTQSGLYRVRYTGPPAKAGPAGNQRSAAAMRALRHKLESFHGREDPTAVAAAWPHLNCADPWIRAAARVAVEAQPVATWKERALAEKKSTAALTALMALARTADPTIQPRLLDRLNAIPFAPLDEDQRLIMLRAYELAFIRMGRPDAAHAAQALHKLDAVYPATQPLVNRQLGQILRYLDAPDLVAKTVPLITAAQSREDKFYFLQLLRNVATGWTREQTFAYFQALAEVKAARGGRQYQQYAKFILDEATARLSPGERVLASKLLEKTDKPATPAPPPRPFVKAWTMADFENGVAAVERGRNFQRGQAMFSAAACSRCHQMGETGGVIGPDLTSVGQRFGTRDILRSIIEPSAVVDEKYRVTIITTRDGRTVEGTVLDEDETSVTLSPNPLTTETESVPKAKIQRRQVSLVSPMPTGLIDTLTHEEIFDLLAYVFSGGNAGHRSFQP